MLGQLAVTIIFLTFLLPQSSEQTTKTLSRAQFPGLIYLEVSNSPYFSGINISCHDNGQPQYKLIIYVSEERSSQISTPQARWFLNRKIDIKLFIDTIPIFFIEDYFFDARSMILDDDYHTGPRVSDVQICFETSLSPEQHTYKLEFTNVRGERYIYRL